jgi:hypothetical protein
MEKVIAYQEAGKPVAVVVPVADMPIDEIRKRTVPDGAAYVIIDASSIPAERVFRNAWQISGGKVEVSLPVAKDIAHNKRRAAREKEFSPWDEIIAKQIPGAQASEAEQERQKIRNKYALVQAQIDDATTELELINIVGVLE